LGTKGIPANIRFAGLWEETGGLAEIEKGREKMKMRITIFTLAALMIGFAAPVAAQQDSTGMVVASRGEVIALSNGGSRELKQGDFIYVNDEIITSNRSFAVLQFEDGAKVTVRPDSTMIIETYLYNGDGNDEATLNLVEGGLRVITGAMAKTNPENYKVRTPVALMGVRGTEFSVMLCGDQLCAEDEMGID
jgi:hypothetical protein